MREHEVENPSLNVSSGEEEPDKLEWYANLSLWGIGVLAFWMLLFYFWKFSSMGFSGDQAHWGVLGDYIGGVLNPAISLAALYWLTRSIILQKRELRESRKALLDAAFSQSQQVKTSETAAKFQLLSMEMGIISSLLAAEITYQTQILEILNSDREIKEVFDRSGVLQSAETALRDVQREIERLKSRRDRVFKATKVIAPGFDIEIMYAKSI
jgi:hypothetical protein